jgi:hypothetical protein
VPVLERLDASLIDAINADAAMMRALGRSNDPRAT